MKIIKLILLILSLISASYTMLPGAAALSYIFVIPLVYGLAYYFLVPETIMLGPGFTMMNFVLFVRYIIYPPVFKYYDFQMNLINSENYVSLAICISIVEIFTILLAVKFSNINNINLMPITTKPINKRVPFALFFVAIITYILNPDVFANMHFILNPEMIIAEKAEFDSNVWVKVMEWTQLFIVLFVLSFLFSKYRSVLLVVTVALISCMFYSGHSRLSLLIPLVTTMFLIAKLFPGKKKLIYLIFFLFALFAMTSLTIVKTFRVESVSEITMFNPSQLLNSYFGGIPNIIVGLQANDFFADKIGMGTIINDMFRNGMGISSFFKSNNNSVYYFNHTFPSLGYDQIVPTICQGVFYFGYLFFWIPTLLMVKLVMYSDKIYFGSSKIEYVWVFSSFAVAIGFAIPGSFQHVFINLHSLLFPLLILVVINRLNIRRLFKIISIPLLNKLNTLKKNTDCKGNKSLLGGYSEQ